MNFTPSGRQGFYHEITAGGGGGYHEEDSDDHNQMLFRRGGGGEGSSSTTAAAVVEREHMFDKVVTPSDVGKLNRLVIPKQHAEKYFPLDSSTNEKGLLLNFEDSNGKPWRFRYSYWNSSQSYVMTKGWSRFVKEKKLDAGDIVSFQRGVGEKDRLFIDWRRRPDAPLDHPLPHHIMMTSPLHPPYPRFNYSSHFVQPVAATPYGYGPPGGSLVYLRSGGGALAPPQQRVFDSVPVVQGKAAAKRLRLFGVNMDCPISEAEEEDRMCDNHVLSLPLHHHYHLPAPAPPPSPSLPSLRFLRHHQSEHQDDKGKGSMSLDLDI